MNLALKSIPAVGAVALRERLARMRGETANTDSKELLDFAIRREFPERIAVISSFAAESVVLLHQVAEIDPETPVLFLNTGKLFGETLRYRDRLQETLGLTDIRCIGPHPVDREESDPNGDLWSRDPDTCCNFRKTIPLTKALAGFDAVLTGRKRFQTEERAAMQAIELLDGRFRFNPLADWSLAKLQNYVAHHHLPPHPLAEDGFLSIGCMPCTRRVNPGENYRDGRWAGFDKRECGIHLGMDGEGI